MARIRRMIAGIGRRHLISVVALMVWVAVVAASAGDEPGRDYWIGFGQLPEILWLTFIIVGLGLFLFLMLAADGSAVVEQREVKRGRFWSIALLVALVALAVVFPRQANEREEETKDRAPVEIEPAAEVGAPASSGIGPGERIALAALVAISLSALTWSLRRDRPGGKGVARVADELALPTALVEAQRQLLDMSDPRAAVLAAYASLEEALAAIGQSRLPTETPTEHLGRVGPGLNLHAATLHRLALRYERARFGQGSITNTDRAEANADLNRLTTHLDRATVAR